MERKIDVWDLPVRVSHWTIVVLVFAMWLTSELGGEWLERHMVIGYVLLGVVLFRLIWGIIGTRYARFTGFAWHPRGLLDHLRHFFSRTPSGYIGHNPMGTLSVVALLGLLLFQLGTGLFVDDDIYLRGPLATWVDRDMRVELTALHKEGFHVLLALIVLHVAAILYYRVVKRESLVLPMITGKKRVPESSADQAADLTGWWWRALIAALISATTVYGIVNWT